MVKQIQKIKMIDASRCAKVMSWYVNVDLKRRFFHLCIKCCVSHVLITSRLRFRWSSQSFFKKVLFLIKWSGSDIQPKKTAYLIRLLHATLVIICCFTIISRHMLTAYMLTKPNQVIILFFTSCYDDDATVHLARLFVPFDGDLVGCHMHVCMQILCISMYVS